MFSDNSWLITRMFSRNAAFDCPFNLHVLCLLLPFESVLLLCNMPDVIPNMRDVAYRKECWTFHPRSSQLVSFIRRRTLQPDCPLNCQREEGVIHLFQRMYCRVHSADVLFYLHWRWAVWYSNRCQVKRKWYSWRKWMQKGDFISCLRSVVRFCDSSSITAVMKFLSRQLFAAQYTLRDLYHKILKNNERV